MSDEKMKDGISIIESNDYDFQFDVPTNYQWTICSQENNDYVSLIMNSTGFYFEAGNRNILRIDIGGNCYKNDELVTKDEEMFEELKKFMKRFNNSCL